MTIESKEKKMAAYHDYANVRDEDLEKVVNQPLSEGSKKTRKGPRGGVATPFPVKLHQLLEEDAYPEIISWQPHGRSFILRNPQAFLSKVMTRYFKQTKLTSFQRQLNLYAFKRISSGPDKGSYYHELFLKGKPTLCSLMIRMRVKGTKVKASGGGGESEPNFYRMTPLTRCDSNSVSDEDGTVASQSLPPLVKSSDQIQDQPAPKALVSDDSDCSAASESASNDLFRTFAASSTFTSNHSHINPPQFISPPMDLLREPIISEETISEPKPVSFEGKAFYYLDSFEHWDGNALPPEQQEISSAASPDVPTALVGLSVVSGELCGFERC